MVVRDRHLAGRKSLRAGEHLRERANEQVFGAHPEQRRRDALAAALRARKEQRARRVPAPARAEHRRGEERLDEEVLRGVRVEVVEDLLEREAVLRPEREDDRLFVGRRLELEAEAAAEPLAKRQTPRAVDAPAERRVDDELHAPDSSKKRSATTRCGVGNRTERALTFLQVVRELGRHGLRRADFFGQPAWIGAVLANPPIASESSGVRAGASPNQKGEWVARPGRRRRGPFPARPSARATMRSRAGRCRCSSIRREILVERPDVDAFGSRSTWYAPVSGIAPRRSER
jgi:hypothetical protein